MLSAFTKRSCSTNNVEEIRRAIVKQMFTLTALVERSVLKGSKNNKVRIRPTMETQSRTWDRILWDST